MRRRITFLAGIAVGFVAGARAGRERYEQMVKLGRKAVEHPAVQQATHAASAKAAELSKAAGQKASQRMPKIVRDGQEQREQGEERRQQGARAAGPQAWPELRRRRFRQRERHPSRRLGQSAALSRQARYSLASVWPVPGW